MIQVGNIVRVTYPTYWADKSLVRVIRVFDFDGLPMITFDHEGTHFSIPQGQVALVSRVRSAQA